MIKIGEGMVKGKEKSWFVYIIITAVISAAIVGCSIYFWQKAVAAKEAREDRKNIENLENKLRSLQKETDKLNKKAVQSSDSGEAKNKESDITSVNATWNKYTNYNMGFSIKIPKKIYHPNGSCKLVDSKSYRPEIAQVPVKVFEEGEFAYISTEYYYVLGQESDEGDYHYFGSCDQITNSIEKINDKNQSQHQQYWKINISTLSDETEIDKYLKDNYGKTCSIGSKKSSKTQTGVYNIEIKQDNRDPETSKCFINYAYIIKYYPDKNLLASWHLGQACRFYGSSDASLCYDESMVESFRFD